MQSSLSAPSTNPKRPNAQVRSTSRRGDGTAPVRSRISFETNPPIVLTLTSAPRLPWYAPSRDAGRPAADQQPAPERSQGDVCLFQSRFQPRRCQSPSIRHHCPRVSANRPGGAWFHQLGMTPSDQRLAESRADQRAGNYKISRYRKFVTGLSSRPGSKSSYLMRIGFRLEGSLVYSRSSMHNANLPPDGVRRR